MEGVTPLPILLWSHVTVNIAVVLRGNVVSGPALLLIGGSVH